MTLHTGLRLPEKLAGMMGLSGYLPLLDTAEAERHGANARTPIFLAHGTFDPVVPLARARPRWPSCSAWAATCAGTPMACRIPCAPRKWPTSRASCAKC